MLKGKNMVGARSVEGSTGCSRAYKEVRSLGRTHSLPLVSGAGSYTLARLFGRQGRQDLDGYLKMSDLTLKAIEVHGFLFGHSSI